MIRLLLSYALVGILTISGLSLAMARGHNPDHGTEITICSGLGMTSIIVGDDGQPVKTTQICPDAATLFVALFDLPGLGDPLARLLMTTAPLIAPQFTTENGVSPTARGPPAFA